MSENMKVPEYIDFGYSIIRLKDIISVNQRIKINDINIPDDLMIEIETPEQLLIITADNEDDFNNVYDTIAEWLNAKRYRVSINMLDIDSRHDS